MKLRNNLLLGVCYLVRVIAVVVLLYVLLLSMPLFMTLTGFPAGLEILYFHLAACGLGLVAATIIPNTPQHRSDLKLFCFLGIPILVWPHPFLLPSVIAAGFVGLPLGRKVKRLDCWLQRKINALKKPGV